MHISPFVSYADYEKRIMQMKQENRRNFVYVWICIFCMNIYSNNLLNFFIVILPKHGLVNFLLVFVLFIHFITRLLLDCSFQLFDFAQRIFLSTHVEIVYCKRNTLISQPLKWHEWQVRNSAWAYKRRNSHQFKQY